MHVEGTLVVGGTYSTFTEIYNTCCVLGVPHFVQEPFSSMDLQ